MFLIIGLAIIYYVSRRFYRRIFPTPNIDPKGKYVLISGCDTGFGHALAIELDQQSFNVLAGVLLPENVTLLKSKLSPNATVFRLDITKQDDIDAAYDLVKEKTNTLHALVNNAGIVSGSNIDWTSMDLMRKVMDVNFFGHVAMTKKFLPLLISKRGSRVVNISSVNGFLAIGGTAAYSASKFALESFSDCLRREMFPWGLYVSIIEPGVMRTPIIRGIDDQLRDLWKELSSDVQKRWGVKFLNDTILQWVSSPAIVNAENPLKVVRAIQHAVVNTSPRIRYRPGYQAKFIYLANKIFPAWMQDKFFIYTSKLVPAGVRHQLKD